MTGRRSLGFGTDEGPSVELTIPSRKSPEEIALRRQAAEEAAKISGFPSREPAPQIAQSVTIPAIKPDRRKRTGRDKAFTCRTTTGHYDRFYAIVDANPSWGGVGATFERALEALEEKLGSR